MWAYRYSTKYCNNPIQMLLFNLELGTVNTFMWFLNGGKNY